MISIYEKAHYKHLWDFVSIQKSLVNHYAISSKNRNGLTVNNIQAIQVLENKQNDFSEIPLGECAV